MFTSMRKDNPLIFIFCNGVREVLDIRLVYFEETGKHKICFGS